MEEKKTVIDYIEQVMKIFGFSIITLNLVCTMFGEDAKDISSMFAMGKEGLCVATMIQFLTMAAWIVLFRFLFFTDVMIKSMRAAGRTCGMIISILIVMVIYVLAFGWFPADDWFCWMIFLVCFLICFVVSFYVMLFKEKWENRRMEEALQKIKEAESTAE